MERIHAVRKNISVFVSVIRKAEDKVGQLSLITPHEVLKP